MRTGDLFECSEDHYTEIESTGHFVEPVSAKCAVTDPEYHRFASMSEDELRLYADQHFKLTFHSGVQKPEMIAAIMAREGK